MTQEEALAAAQRHNALLNAEYPLPADFQRAVPEAVEYRDFWYFAYTSVHVRGLPPEQWDVNTLFAGAPGYVVSKRSGTVQAIGWAQQHGLREQEARLIQFEQLATELAQQALTLKLLRAHVQLPLPALQKFRQELASLGPPQRAQLLRQLMAQAHFTPLLADETAADYL